MLQELSNNYACLQTHVNNALTWQSSCVIANNARTHEICCLGINRNLWIKRFGIASHQVRYNNLWSHVEEFYCVGPLDQRPHLP